MDDASLRASDADREQAVAALREHMVAGRLTLEEFCARVDAALRSTVAGELSRLQDGVNVDVAGLTVFGHRRDWGRDGGQPDTPIIHVRVFGLAGTVDVWRVPRELRDSSYGDIVRTMDPRLRPPR